MSQKGIGGVGKPRKRDRVDRGKNARLSGFETLGDCHAEDLERAKGLRKAAKKHSDKVNVEEMLALAAKLEEAGRGGKVPKSLASSTYMRRLRIKIVGALWLLIRLLKGMKASAFTIIPRTWEFTPEGLDEVAPSRLLASLRVALYGQGAAKAKGWIIAFIHGEFDPIGGVYRLHVHGYAFGEMVAVIDRLRTLPNYKTKYRLKDGSLNPVYRRIQVKRKLSTNLLRQITYCVQSFWPAKAIFISDDGSRTRARTKQRISEPYHSRVLLWLDKWSIADLTLMIGLRVTKDGLIQTKRSS